PRAGTRRRERRAPADAARSRRPAPATAWRRCADRQPRVHPAVRPRPRQDGRRPARARVCRGFPPHRHASERRRRVRRRARRRQVTSPQTRLAVATDFRHDARTMTTLTPQDEEHLRLLAIFHYVVAGITALFSLIPIAHITVGILMVMGKLESG